MSDGLALPPLLLAELRRLRAEQETGQLCLHLSSGEIRAAEFRPAEFTRRIRLSGQEE